VWEDGRPEHPDVILQRFNRLSARSGLPHIRLHDMRRSYATAALKIVSARLGHHSEAFTASVYQHALPGMDRDAAGRVAALFLDDEVEGGRVVVRLCPLLSEGVSCVSCVVCSCDSRAVTALRAYWSAIPLGAFALIMLVVGYFTTDEFAAVGWAAAGATVVRIVDVGQERGRARTAEREARRKGLDETRRLLYMATMTGARDSAELNATLVNALAHHGMGISDHVSLRILAKVDGAPSRQEWIVEQIRRITDELGDWPVNERAVSKSVSRRGQNAPSDDL
jgi:hypothetical protein